MTLAIFRRLGLLSMMLALLAGALLLTPGGPQALANRLSPDGNAGGATAMRLRTGGLCSAALILLAGAALAAFARAAAASMTALRTELGQTRARLGGALRQKAHRRELVALAGVVVFGAAARLAWINSPIRLDEAISFMNFSRLGAVHAATHYHTNSHTLNSLLMVLSTALFGEAEAALRLPSLLCGFAVIPLTFLVIRSAAGGAAALVSAALVAAAPGMVEFGFLARGYSIQIMLFLTLLLSVNRLARRGGAWATLGTTLLPALLMYTMLSSLYPVAMTAAWGIWLAWRVRGAQAARTILTAFAASTGLAGLLFAPLLLVSGLAAITDNYYVQPQPLGLVIQRLPSSLLATWDGWWRGLPEWLPLLTIPPFVAGLVRLRGRLPWWTVVTVLPVLLVMQRVVPYPRTWLFLLPLYLGTAAVGAVWLAAKGWPGRGPSGRMALLVALAGALYSPFNRAVEISPECSGWPDDREVVSMLHQQGVSVSDRVVSNSVYGRLHYYFRRLGLPADAIDLPPDRETKRVFLIHIPIGVDWRIHDALGVFEQRLGPWQTVAEFRHGTRLSVATLREESSPSDPAQFPGAPAP